MKQNLNTLSEAEKRVIINKGTEAPFSGKYDKHFSEGTYFCKQCGAALYSSKDKFDAKCGWPAFDDEILGAIKRIPDADGFRTEILCSNCSAHLGHVFENEGFTPKNIRHCVNSISLYFKAEPQPKLQSKFETAIFAGGCFWGVQHHLAILDGVLETQVGYIGGKTKNPTYEDVCNLDTGHAEAIKIVFDKTKINFEELAKIFFEIHDPGQLNRQGPDLGNQYRSAIFYTNNEQKLISEKLINILREKSYEVVTELIPASEFFVAEDYHQNYYKKSGARPYCHFYQKKF